MLGQMEIDRPTREFVRYIAEDWSVDGIDIFCCDKTHGRGEIFDLYGHGMDRELKEGYRRARIFECDPFTDVTLREALCGSSDCLELAGDPLIAGGERAERYWRFMNQLDVEIVGAATRRFLPGFYLVIGLHRLKSSDNRPEISRGRLSSQLGQVKDMVSASILSRMLRTGDGYRQLRHTFGHGNFSAPAGLPELSPRETEIAHLVCAGKQNKEIAWLTGLSVNTIENHIKRIYRKFHIQNRAALVAKIRAQAN